jgi:hypothetical protein
VSDTLENYLTIGGERVGTSAPEVITTIGRMQIKWQNLMDSEAQKM